MEFKIPSSTPFVSRSTYVIYGQAIIINGSNFEDGRIRVVLPFETSDETVKTVEEVLREFDGYLSHVNFIKQLLGGENE